MLKHESGGEYRMELAELLRLSVNQKASDLHLSPELPPILRVNGDLVSVNDHSILSAETTKNYIYSILNNEQREHFGKKLELDLSIEIPNISCFRVNVFHQARGLSAVFRVIPEVIPTLDQLGMPGIFKELVTLSNGLILITGPTGSGKSTTLASMIDHINDTQSVHVITIEDPIEFKHKSKKSLIDQRQIGRDTLHFSSALRSALREDPDVILVGELRDLKTIRLALTAAETGHLVMATLHTSSAPRAISRIIDVFPSGEKNIIKNMLAGSLQAVISQILVKRIDGDRVAAFEIMLGTNSIRNLIREDKIAQMYSSIQTGNAHGMCTLDQYLTSLMEKNMISKIKSFSKTHW